MIDFDSITYDRRIDGGKEYAVAEKVKSGYVFDCEYYVIERGKRVVIKDKEIFRSTRFELVIKKRTTKLCSITIWDCLPSDEEICKFIKEKIIIDELKTKRYEE